LKNIGIGLCCPLKWPNDGDKDAVFHLQKEKTLLVLKTESFTL